MLLFQNPSSKSQPKTSTRSLVSLLSLQQQRERQRQGQQHQKEKLLLQNIKTKQSLSSSNLFGNPIRYYQEQQEEERRKGRQRRKKNQQSSNDFWSIPKGFKSNLDYHNNRVAISPTKFAGTNFLPFLSVPFASTAQTALTASVNAPATAVTAATNAASNAASVASNAATELVATAATATTTAAAATTTSSTFFLHLMIFIAGGLFFSTIIASITACYAFGMDNVTRMMKILNIIVQQVWTTFCIGMKSTRLALLGQYEYYNNYGNTTRKTSDDQDDKTQMKGDETTSSGDESTSLSSPSSSSWKWRSAWAVLKEQLGETRRTAAKGVQALREEAKLYSAAIGAPGLIPLQYIVDRLMPFSISTILEDSIKNALMNMKQQNTIKRVSLSNFSAGPTSPILEAARVYDVDDAIAFDYDVKWDSELEATIQLYTVGGLARVPVSIKNVKFDGVIRVILTPLLKTPPGYGAALLSLTTPPTINLDVRVLGSEVTRLPFLRTEITTAMQKAIADELLWPKRVVVPSIIIADDAWGGGEKRSLLTNKQLSVLELSDPLLEAETKLSETQPTYLHLLHGSGNQQAAVISTSSSLTNSTSMENDDDDVDAKKNKIRQLSKMIQSKLLHNIRRRRGTRNDSKKDDGKGSIRSTDVGVTTLLTTATVDDVVQSSGLSYHKVNIGNIEKGFIWQQLQHLTHQKNDEDDDDVTSVTSATSAPALLSSLTTSSGR